ncbi:hypothetical protein JHK85_006985 [Glycine max]|nr:hypothetical protein JHK85_006985 [Glycine max]
MQDIDEVAARESSLTSKGVRGGGKQNKDKGFVVEEVQVIGGKVIIPNSATRMLNNDEEHKEVTESTQQAFKSLEIQVGKLAEEVTKFVAKREENFVEVEAHEESIVEEHDSKEKYEEKVRRKHNNGRSTHK